MPWKELRRPTFTATGANDSATAARAFLDAHSHTDRHGDIHD